MSSSFGGSGRKVAFKNHTEKPRICLTRRMFTRRQNGHPCTYIKNRFFSVVEIDYFLLKLMFNRIQITYVPLFVAQNVEGD